MIIQADVNGNMLGKPYRMDMLDPLAIGDENPLTAINPWNSPKDYRYPFQNDYTARLSGLADGEISTTVTSAGFGADLMAGARMWLTPGAAFTALNDVAMGSASAPIAYTVGLAAPPVVALVVLLGLLKGRR